MSPLERLLALHRPGVGVGNYQADVYSRGWNACLLKAIVAAGLATGQQVMDSFAQRDREYAARTQAALDRANARDGA